MKTTMKEGLLKIIDGLKTKVPEKSYSNLIKTENIIKRCDIPEDRQGQDDAALFLCHLTGGFKVMDDEVKKWIHEFGDKYISQPKTSQEPEASKKSRPPSSTS